jgi:flagellar biosynthesis protein FliQ
MTAALAVEWFRQMLWAAILISAPTIAAAVVVSLIVSIIQAATQVNDQAVSFAPKALAVVLALAVSAHWMLSELSRFTVSIFSAIARIHQ